MIVETVRTTLSSATLGLHGERHRPTLVPIEMVIEWVDESVLRMIDLEDVI